MKKNGYPLIIATMLVIVFFEAMEITEDLKEKKNMIFGGTLSETVDSGQAGWQEPEGGNATLSDLIDSSQKAEEAEGSKLADSDIGKPGTEKAETKEPSDGKAEEEGPKELVPVEAYVDESYFDDAVFIGDSRIYGLMQYSGLENATFYTSIGLNIYDLFDKKYITLENGGGRTDLETALKIKKFNKIYLMVGLNELGRDKDEGFADTYREAVEHIKELQPDAIIYIHAILKVTERKSRKDKVIKNDKVDARNALIAEIPNGKDVFWIDINEIFCGEDGTLKREYTGDEVHLYAKYYKMWVEYLKEHAYIFVEKSEAENMPGGNMAEGNPSEGNLPGGNLPIEEQ